MKWQEVLLSATPSQLCSRTEQRGKGIGLGEVSIQSEHAPRRQYRRRPYQTLSFEKKKVKNKLKKNEVEWNNQNCLGELNKIWKNSINSCFELVLGLCQRWNHKDVLPQEKAQLSTSESTESGGRWARVHSESKLLAFVVFFRECSFI